MKKCCYQAWWKTLYICNLCYIINLDSRIKDYWLMDSPWPVVIILIAYLYFVLSAGPKFMKYRSPLKIDRIVMVYNVVQVLFSAYLVKEVIQYFIRHDVLSKCQYIFYRLLINYYNNNIGIDILFCLNIVIYFITLLTFVK